MNRKASIFLVGSEYLRFLKAWPGPDLILKGGGGLLLKFKKAGCTAGGCVSKRKKQEKPCGLERNAPKQEALRLPVGEP